MTKEEEQAIELQMFQNNIRKFMSECCIPWGDYTAWEREDIEKCIKDCAVHFYNKGMEAERRGLQNEVHRIHEEWNAKDIKEYDISFGAFDSELIHYEWPLPEGYTAKIEDGKIIIDKSSLTK